jgi:hypothetical protein
MHKEVIVGALRYYPGVMLGGSKEDHENSQLR